MISRDDDIRAAEYALGVLSPAERREADRARSSDPAFAAAVEAWESLLSPLADAGPAVTPPESLRTRIEAAINARAGSRPESSPLANRIESLRRSLAAWRMAAIGAAAVTAAIALAWVGGLDTPFRPGVPANRYVAMLKSDTGETGFVVTVDMNDKSCAIRKIAPKLPPSKAYELWAMIKNGKPPMSLGVVGPEEFVTTPMPTDLDPEMLREGVQLAISLEPPGGAPQKHSMGPVVFAGELVKLAP